MTNFALVHSPFVGPGTWEPVASVLRELGHSVLVPSLARLTLGGAPYWPRCVDLVEEQCPAREEDIVLVGHSGAGPLLPLIADALGNVAALIFVDATLPISGYRRSATTAAGERAAPMFEGAPEHGFVSNPWQDPATWRIVGIRDPEWARALAAEAPPITPAMNEEPVSLPGDWTETPAAYLAFVPSEFYASEAAQARVMGWPVIELPGAHFHMLIDPQAVAIAVAELAEEITAPPADAS
jgi:Alpha/beta hydrolase family